MCDLAKEIMQQIEKLYSDDSIDAYGKWESLDDISVVVEGLKSRLLVQTQQIKTIMTVTEALQLIERNSHIPALNYCINYAHYALQLNQTTKDFKVQLLYVLNNMIQWRQCKASTTTAAEIKECRATLKKASV